MKVGRMLVCFVFAGSSVVAVAVPAVSVLSGMMLYWNEDRSFKKKVVA